MITVKNFQLKNKSLKSVNFDVFIRFVFTPKNLTFLWQLEQAQLISGKKVFGQFYEILIFEERFSSFNVTQCVALYIPPFITSFSKNANYSTCSFENIILLSI